MNKELNDSNGLIPGISLLVKLSIVYTGTVRIYDIIYHTEEKS